MRHVTGRARVGSDMKVTCKDCKTQMSIGRLMSLAESHGRQELKCPKCGCIVGKIQ